MKTYLKTREVATRLRKSPRTIEYWRQIDYGPRYIRAGRDCLYDLELIEQWEQQQYANTA
jgi:hypothetical protein